MTILAGLGVILSGCDLLGIGPMPKVYKGTPEYEELCHFTWYMSRETKRQAMDRVSDEAVIRCRPNLTVDIVIDLG